MASSGTHWLKVTHTQLVIHCLKSVLLNILFVCAWSIPVATNKPRIPSFNSPPSTPQQSLSPKSLDSEPDSMPFSTDDYFSVSVIYMQM